MQNIKMFLEDNFPSQSPTDACESLTELLETLSERYGNEISIFYDLVNAVRLDLEADEGDGY